MCDPFIAEDEQVICNIIQKTFFFVNKKQFFSCKTDSDMV